MKKKIILLLASSVLFWLPVSILAETGTTKIKNVDPSIFTEMGDFFYFSSSPHKGGTDGYGLWKSDGTSSGTVMIKDFTGKKKPLGLINGGGVLYFCGYETSSGWELWKSDGTESGTTRIIDLHPGEEDGVSSTYCSLSYLDGKIFFSGNTGYINGYRDWALWKTDGTGANTTMVHDLRPADGSGILNELFIMNDTLFFSGSDGVHGEEWWKCEGPLYDSASMVADIWPNQWSGINSYKHPVLDGYFYFQGNDGTNGKELWRSNGTEVGTEMVKDINPSGDGSVYKIMVANGGLFFKADNGAAGGELWKSDGTESGTVMVKDINPSAGSDSEYYIAVGSDVYLVADDGTHGTQIWKSDGTENGTVRVTDINTSGGNGIRDLIQFENNVFFRADDGVTGDELWMSDGSAGNATLVADIVSGSDSSWPGNFFVFNDALFFGATYDNNLPEGDGDGLYRYGEITSSHFSWLLFLPAILHGREQ